MTRSTWREFGVLGGALIGDADNLKLARAFDFLENLMGALRTCSQDSLKDENKHTQGFRSCKATLFDINPNTIYTNTSNTPINP